MQKQQDAGRITAGNDRPFSWYSADIDLGELGVVGYRPMRTNLVEALAPVGPSDGSRLGTQERANGLDFALNHFFCLLFQCVRAVIAWVCISEFVLGLAV